LKFRAVAILAIPLVALAACDKPKARQVSTEVSGPKGHSTEPLPANPEWLTVLLGRNLSEAMPQKGACVGNTDLVDTRYEGASPGTRIIGWGWDTEAKAPVARVVLVDGGGTIVGGGETGQNRPDVPAARPDITTPAVGWAAITTLTKGPLDTYGITTGGQGTCFLGHMDL
jgi:hypothetical protein